MPINPNLISDLAKIKVIIKKHEEKRIIDIERKLNIILKIMEKKNERRND